MNIKEYISSGILEQYLLGELSPAEERELELNMAKYPEIRQEYFLLADAFEKMSQKAGITPPNQLKQQILSQIGEPNLPKTSVQTRLSKSGNRLAMILVGSFLAGLMVLASMMYYCNKQKEGLQAQISALNTQLTSSLEERNRLNERIDLLAARLNILGNPAYRRVDLKGLPIAPQAFAQIYWNNQTQEVLLKANQLPAPEQGKQYQLWAIVKEGPLDLGVFDWTAEETLLKMNNTGNALSFAITLEERGGVPAPTLSAIYVLGNVSS